MSDRRATKWPFSLAVLVATGLLLPAAQARGGQDRQPPPSIGTRDFLFGSPRAWVAVRGSWVMTRAEGELFTFVQDHLTVEKNDFNAPAVVSEVGFVLTSRLDVAGSVEFSRGSASSEYRRFVDNQGLPINQYSELTQTNLAASVRFALLDRGRPISRYAFVPRTVSPFAGAGGGMLYYKFEQRGDFVDFLTLRVFTDAFRSTGWTPSAHVFAGADVRVWRSLFVDVEGRYVWAHGDLGPDFVGFSGIDLDGFRLSSGINVVF